jgi:hypothetical protein
MVARIHQPDVKSRAELHFSAIRQHGPVYKRVWLRLEKNQHEGLKFQLGDSLLPESLNLRSSASAMEKAFYAIRHQRDTPHFTHGLQSNFN